MSASPKIHFSRIRHIGAMTHTGTLCGRMVSDGDINCTGEPAEVTCKLCQRELAAQIDRVAA